MIGCYTRLALSNESPQCTKDILEQKTIHIFGCKVLVHYLFHVFSSCFYLEGSINSGILNVSLLNNLKFQNV